MDDGTILITEGVGTRPPRAAYSVAVAVVNIDKEVMVWQNSPDPLDKGHKIARVKAGGFGGYQAIRIDSQRGTLHGATESRKDGVALGY